MPRPVYEPFVYCLSGGDIKLCHIETSLQSHRKRRNPSDNQRCVSQRIESQQIFLTLVSLFLVLNTLVLNKTDFPQSGKKMRELMVIPQANEILLLNYPH